MTKIINEQLEVIDLFSGCGGLALGFQNEGMNIKSGMELDGSAANTASYNLHWKHGVDNEHLCGDVTLANGNDFANYNKPIVIGGPPCQAYSMAGRAKLNSLGEERHVFKDSRGALFQDFLRIALELNARAVVMENVPESVNYNGINIPETVCEILTENGYNAIWTVLNSADFGVPQIRERVFVIAIKKEMGNIEHLPEPTHKRPDHNFRTMNEGRFASFSQTKYFTFPLPAKESLPKWITVKDAISDLPILFPVSTSVYKLHNQELTLPYQSPPQSDYQELMRSGVRIDGVSGNGFRNTKRDFKIFEQMAANDNYRDAHDIAMKMLAKECIKKKIKAKTHPNQYEVLKKSIVPPYSINKFLTKWKKLDPHKPSHTLVAHLGTDTYSHIHPWEPRGISVREAARLQSFPDDFYFNCSMTEAFKQIGNAVPPLLSKAVATALRKNLGEN
ncbi:DNA cytosine methyltransferase [Planomicrobium okeanokoites]|uniref:DNA (cytosine-5-)-methyltransferase n=1 Tax=Planomicrobium okeanokoites TaxID=244 RepID=A0ABV7KSN6_PLAOK|nr:DNA cytosine methyltransferase [Planomicrobium okeanokoites]